MNILIFIVLFVHLIIVLFALNKDYKYHYNEWKILTIKSDIFYSFRRFMWIIIIYPIFYYILWAINIAKLVGFK